MVVTLEVFTSKTCPHCPKAKEVASKVKEKIGDDLDYQDLDVDENITKAMEYGIMAVPTMVIDGEVVFTGAPRTKELYQEITKRL